MIASPVRLRIAAALFALGCASPAHAQRPLTFTRGLPPAAALRDTIATDSASAKSAVRSDAVAPRSIARWTQGMRASAAARALLEVLGDLDARGVNPAELDVAPLRVLAAAPFASDSQRTDFESRLTSTARRAIRWLAFGRATVDATAPVDSVMEADAMGRLASGENPAAVFDAMEPRGAQYQALRRALPRYRSLAMEEPIAAQRAAQIARALEQWRALPRQPDGVSVIVNIPAFELSVVTTQADSITSDVRMRVIVGDSALHPTPIFSDSIRFIEFAPYWIVPPTIVRAELLPVAKRDPYLLTLNNYQIIDARSRVLPATAANVARVERGTAGIRQLPGGTNALGQVKFLFPNAHDVYLHDTPARGEFRLERRDRSHGCIRVADPAGLAALLLRGDSSWNTASIAHAMQAKTATRVTLARPIPVHIIYATAASRSDGSIVFYDDVYGLDAAEGARAISEGPSRP